jgi:hypothetical protein
MFLIVASVAMLLLKLYASFVGLGPLKSIANNKHIPVTMFLGIHTQTVDNRDQTDFLVKSVCGASMQCQRTVKVLPVQGFCRILLSYYQWVN